MGAAASIAPNDGQIGPAQLSVFKECKDVYENSKSLPDTDLLLALQRQCYKGVKLSFLRKFINDNGGEEKFRGLSLKEVCNDYIAILNHPGEAYIDYLVTRESDQVGVADIFITESFKYEYLYCVRTLEHYFNEVTKEGTDIFIFFDLFCMDQNDIPPPQLHMQASAVFKRHVLIIGPYDQPIPFTSARCLVDIYRNADHVELAMGPGEEHSFVRRITTGEHKTFLKQIQRIDILQCKTYKGTAQGFDFVKRNYLKGGDTAAIDHFNSTIRNVMVDKWILATMDRYLDRIDEDDPNFSDAIDIHWSDYIVLERMEALSLLLKELKRFDEALSLRQRSIAVNTKIYGDDSPSLGPGLSQMGALYESMNDWRTALEYHEKCLHLYLQNPGAHILHHKKKIKGGKEGAPTEVVDDDHKLPIGPVYYHIAMINEKNAEYGKAMENLTKSLEYAIAHKTGGGHTGATGHRHVKRMSPGHVHHALTLADLPIHEIKQHMAEVYSHLREYDHSLKYALEALEDERAVAGSNSLSLAYAMGSVSLAYERLENREKSEEYREMAVFTNPDIAEDLEYKRNALIDAMVAEEEARQEAREREASAKR